MNETASARLRADTKSLQVLTTSGAEFTRVARAGSRTVGLRNSCNHGKKHCYTEGPTSDPLQDHVGILPKPSYRLWSAIEISALGSLRI
ncbi:MAG: hypothetical protein WCD69_03650 [Xanthobacteraceae bacterium]